MVRFVSADPYFARAEDRVFPLERIGDYHTVDSRRVVLDSIFRDGIGVGVSVCVRRREVLPSIANLAILQRDRVLQADQRQSCRYGYGRLRRIRMAMECQYDIGLRDRSAYPSLKRGDLGSAGRKGIGHDERIVRGSRPCHRRAVVFRYIQLGYAVHIRLAARVRKVDLRPSVLPVVGRIQYHAFAYKLLVLAFRLSEELNGDRYLGIRRTACPFLFYVDRSFVRYESVRDLDALAVRVLLDRNREVSGFAIHH